MVLTLFGWFLLTWTCAAAGNRPLDNDLVLRQHYGVAFTPVQTFTATTGYWLHTFAFSLPSRPLISDRNVLNCSWLQRNASDTGHANVTHCLHVKPFVDKISSVQHDMSQMLYDILIDIERLVPQRRTHRSSRTRHTRSWLPFLGSALKTITGTATTDDVARVQKAVDDIRRTAATAYNQFAQSQADMASMIHVANQRMTALYRLVENQRQSMRAQYFSFSSALDDLFSMTSLVPTLVARASEFSNALVHMTELRSALLDALHGHLNNFLVSSSTMLSALHRINSALRRVHPSLHTVYSTPADVYQSNDFIIHRIGRDIFITIKFHVTPLADTLTLYKVRLFPVALPDGSRHVTTLATMHTAFAYSPTLRYFIEFRAMPDIRNHMLDITRADDMLQSISASSCILALFQNVPSRIREHCSFKLTPNSLEPSVILLDASTVLFTNTTNITRTCVDVPTTVLPGCTQCIYRLPCHCSFHTETMYIPPTSLRCGPQVSNRTQQLPVHVTNLAVLSHFFSEQDLGELASDTFLRHPITADMPPFQLYEHNYSVQVAAVHRTQLALSKAVNLTLARKTVYRSMADYLSHKRENTQYEGADSIFWGMSSTVYSPLTIASVVVSGFALFLTILLSVKVRAMSSLLISARPTLAFPTHLNFFQTTPLVSTEFPTQMNQYAWTPYNIVFMTSLLTIVVCMIVLALCSCTERCNRPIMSYPRTYVFLQLNTSSSFVYLKFLKLQYPMSYYELYASSPIKSIHLAGHLFPRLYINWPDLLIRNVVHGETIVWPKCINLTYKQATTLRTALLPASADSINPLFYYYRPGMSGPLVLQTESQDNGNTDRSPEPSAPATVDIHLKRLYLIV